MKTEAAPAPSPDLADAPLIRRAGPLDILMITRSLQGCMSREEIVRSLPSIAPAEVCAIIAYAIRHPEEMEDYLSCVMEWARRRERVTRGSARLAAPQQGELDGDAQDEPQAVAPARRRRAAAHRRRRSGDRPRRRLPPSVAHVRTGGLRGRLERTHSRLRRGVSCFNALVARVQAIHNAAVCLERVMSQVSIFSGA